MHWGEYQPRQVAQTDNQWDVAQGEVRHAAWRADVNQTYFGKCDMRGSFLYNNEQAEGNMPKEAEPGTSEQMPYSHIPRENSQIKNIAKHPEQSRRSQCRQYMHTGVCNFEKNCYCKHPERERKRHNYVSREGRHFRLQPTIQDEADWSVLNVDDWKQTETEAPLLDRKVYNPATPELTEERRKSQRNNPPCIREAVGHHHRSQRRRTIPCKYYMLTGLCKFGTACKFFHPTQDFGQYRQSGHGQDKLVLRAGGRQHTAVGKLEGKPQLVANSTAQTEKSLACKRKKENAAGPADDMENSELINKHIGSTDKNLNDEPASSVLYSEPYLTGNPSIAATCDMYIKAQDREFPVNSSLIIIHSKVLGKKILESKKNLGSSALPLVACLPKESQADIQLLLEVLYCYRTRINTVEEAATLLALAHKYQISYPVTICEQWLCQEVHNMHVAGIHHHPKASASLVMKPRIEKKNWSLAKWLLVAEQLGMKELEQRCLCALTTVFLSDEIQQENSKNAVIAELVDDYKVSSRSMAALAGAMGGWICSLAQSWWCRKCGDESSIPREEKCSKCRSSYFEDRAAFGCSSFGSIVEVVREDEAIVMEMLKTMDMDGLRKSAM